MLTGLALRVRGEGTTASARSGGILTLAQIARTGQVRELDSSRACRAAAHKPTKIVYLVLNVCVVAVRDCSIACALRQIAKRAYVYRYQLINSKHRLRPVQSGAPAPDARK